MYFGLMASLRLSYPFPWCSSAGTDYGFGKIHSFSLRHFSPEEVLVVSLEKSFHWVALGSRKKSGWNIRSVNLGWRVWQDCVPNFFLKEDLFDIT
jgi:hypothetical protein